MAKPKTVFVCSECRAGILKVERQMHRLRKLEHHRRSRAGAGHRREVLRSGGGA